MTCACRLIEAVHAFSPPSSMGTLIGDELRDESSELERRMHKAAANNARGGELTLEQTVQMPRQRQLFALEPTHGHTRVESDAGGDDEDEKDTYEEAEEEQEEEQEEGDVDAMVVVDEHEDNVNDAHDDIVDDVGEESRRLCHSVTVVRRRPSFEATRESPSLCRVKSAPLMRRASTSTSAQLNELLMQVRRECGFRIETLRYNVKAGNAAFLPRT